MNNSNEKLPSNRKFGILFFIIFLGLYVYTYSSQLILPSFIFSALALITGIVTYFKPSLLKPFNKGWMYFGFTLNKIISPIIISFIFYFLITPISLIGFFFGRDELRIKDVNKNSYWIDSQENETDKFSFYKQF
jgi:hypothetical protein